MAILGKSKICPFKEDSNLIKKINYKELSKTLDFPIEKLNVILQALWEYSVISFYKDK